VRPIRSGAGAEMNAIEDLDDIPDDDLELTLAMIARISARLAKNPGDEYDQKLLAGWIRHLGFIPKEANDHERQ